MTDLYLLFALILLCCTVGGMIRVLLGPTVADRMLAAQLFGTCGIATLLVLSQALASDLLQDVALVLALLAALATTTFVRRTWLDITDKDNVTTPLTEK